MAERIVSPGVFTREKDLSFLPQGVGEIGGCIIGPTKMGPAFWPTVVNNFEEFEEIFGGLSTDTYVPYTAKEYLETGGAGRVTIIRTLGRSEVTNISVLGLSYSGSGVESPDPYGGKTVAMMLPSAFEKESDAIDFATTAALGGQGAGAQAYPSASNFVIAPAGSGTTSAGSVVDAKDASATAYSASFDITKENYIENIFGTTPNTSKRGFLWTNFRVHQQLSSGSNTAGPTGMGSGLVGAVSASVGNTISFPSYQEASTPWITSQKDATNGTMINLFKFHSLSHGTNENYRFKIGISNIITDNTAAGYGTFTVQLRKVNQDLVNPVKRGPYTYTTDDIVEEWSGCSLDPDDSNYVVRRIGDRYYKIDSEGKLIGYNDYPNKSKYIRIEATNVVKDGNLDKSQVPFGFRKLTDPIPSTVGTSPSASYVTRQGKLDEWLENVFYGFNYNFKHDAEDDDGRPAAFDNLNYLMPTPSSNSQTTGQADFNLSNMYGHKNAKDGGSTVAIDSGSLLTPTTGSVSQRKFIVPFQGGFDGIHPSKYKLTGANMASTNVMGFDVSSATSYGTVAYKRAIDAISNPDEWDINLLVTPGLLYTHASTIQNYALRKIEARADAFYLLDVAKFAESPTISTQITDATTDAANFDTSYAATYYPWVKLVDSTNNKHVWVPPSVVLAGVIATTDQSHPWFAPAGLNRGGLTTVLEPATRLTHSERDDLYEKRVNPIAAFPGQNVTVWGQKTLQKRASALDRINVRRLLITVKKFIASSTKFLVFEQNTAATRNRFLSIVNPYLEGVQANSGLFAFKVVMDETNNTPDVIDRNELRGQIFLQPTRTAEFIVLDFNIMPTGAEFPE